MSCNMTKISDKQLDIINRIIRTGKAIGANDDIIYVAINIANAESNFNPNEKNKISSAK